MQIDFQDFLLTSLMQVVSISKFDFHRPHASSFTGPFIHKLDAKFV